jgi:predicted secreted acid phosphatase
VQPTPPAKAFVCRVTAKTFALARLRLNKLISPRSVSRWQFTSLACALAASTALLPLYSASAACNCDQVKIPIPAESDFGSKIGLEFYHSPQYHKEFSQAVHDAREFCTKYKQEHPENHKLAIVSDIDETVIDNSKVFEQIDKVDADAFWVWVDSAQAPELKQTSDFISWARKQGYCIFFITGRYQKERGATILNLNRVGLPYDGLWLRPDGDTRTAEDYKTECRKEIEAMGFTIVESIGDQYSDLFGGHSLDCTKLPNKLYFIK